MTDPVPAVAEADATGEIAAICADIRRTLQVGVVNLIWRHLAILSGALPWAWQAVRPLYRDGTVGSEAAALRSSIALPKVPILQPAALAAVGLSDPDVERIRAVLATNDRTNTMALVALSAIQARITDISGSCDRAAPAPAESPPAWQDDGRLPALLSLAEIPPTTADLLVAISRLGARHRDPILASMHRHLAHSTAHLALAWVMIEPLAADLRLERAITDALGNARAPANRLAPRLPSPRRTLEPAVCDDLSQALDRFIGDVIAKMTVVCALWRRATSA
jgi:hypothetical protein